MQILHLAMLLKILGVGEIAHGLLPALLAQNPVAVIQIFILMKQRVTLLLIASGKAQQLLDGVRQKTAGILMEIKQDAILQM